MPSTGTQKRALRASCDNCHQAKVKCVPTASGCQRCLGLDAPCIHSPPGRSGRAPAVNREHQVLRAPSPAPSNTPRPHSELSELLSDLPGEDEEIQTRSLPSTANFLQELNMEVDVDPIDPMLSGLFSISGSSTSPLHSADNGGNISGSSKHHDSTAGMTTPLPRAMSYYDVGAVSTLSTTSTQSLAGTQLGHVALSGYHSHQSLCTCFPSICRALEKVQGANIATLTLDVALSQNKEALLCICNALKCASPHDSTTRLLILLLLHKNLHLYHLLYQSRLRNPRDSSHDLPNLFSTSPWPTQGLGMDMSQASQPLEPAFPTGHAEERASQGEVSQLTLGIYRLDNADETYLTRHILLLDIKKVPRLLERLDRRACGLDEADCLDLYNIMRSTLIAEFREIINDIEACWGFMAK